LEAIEMNRKTDNDVLAIEDLQTDPPPMENPIYPPEFLDAFTDTAFQAVRDYLKRTGAPKEVEAVLDDLSVLTSWAGEIKHAEKVHWSANQFLLETVASAIRNIVKIGGVFYCPSGTTCSRPGATRAAVPNAR
jgi:hypothetical protein